MNRICKSIIALGLTTLGVAGCSSSDHTPEEQYDSRTPVNERNPHDRGLQSSEVVEASEKLVAELLRLPEVNNSPTRLTVVFTNLEDLTRRRAINYDIFLERLKTEVSAKGRDRIAIVTNKETFYRTRSTERDDAGTPNNPALANRVQPDYALTGKVMDLPGRGTDYYHFTFSLTDIRAGGGTEIPMKYDVKVRN